MKKVILSFALLLLVSMSFVSAGVGISWDKESTLVPEKTKTCLTYKVYNPWPKDVYARVQLSNELQPIVKTQDSEIKFIPKETSSQEAMPVNFCFKTPNIYERDCLIGDSLICKQECNEPLHDYAGTVEVIEISEASFEAGGTGGSTTQMSVSAPLKVRVQCIKSDRNWSVVYLLVALVAGVWLVLNIVKSRKKPKKKKVKKK
jgi:hypothetical protein